MERKNVQDIIQSHTDVISALGYAIYKCNDNCFNRYDDLLETDVIHHMKFMLNNDSEVDERIKFCLRWGFLENVVKVTSQNTTPFIRFTHRCFRDVVGSFFLMSKSVILPDTGMFTF